MLQKVANRGLANKLTGMSFIFRHRYAVTGLALGAAAALYLTRNTIPLRAEASGILDPEKFVSLPVQSSKYVSHDTKEIVFNLPEDHTLGGSTAFMVLFKHIVDGKAVIRPYTPVSTPDTEGHATFVIKAYPNGKMSQHLHSLNVGDSAEVKGPITKYPLSPNQHKQIALLGGGSGITPLYQVLQDIANDPKDKTKVSLYFANKTPDDIILKKDIDRLVAKKPDQLSVTYFVDDPEGDWNGEVGYISGDFLKKNMFKPSDENVKVFVCGPPPMYKALSGGKKSPSDQGELDGALKDLGFTKEQVFKF